MLVRARRDGRQRQCTACTNVWMSAAEIVHDRQRHEIDAGARECAGSRSTD